MVFGTSSVGDWVRDTACDVSLGWIKSCFRGSGLGCDCEWLVGFYLGLGLLLGL